MKVEEAKSVKGSGGDDMCSSGSGGGFRRDEIVRRRLDGIDKVNRAGRVIGKGNKERLVLCSDTVWEYLSKWLSCRENVPSVGIPNVFCVI